MPTIQLHHTTTLTRCSVGRVFPRPVLELRILTTLGIALEKRNRILMSTASHRIIFGGEVLRLAVAKLSELFLRGIVQSGRNRGLHLTRRICGSDSKLG